MEHLFLAPVSVSKRQGSSRLSTTKSVVVALTPRALIGRWPLPATRRSAHRWKMRGLLDLSVYPRCVRDGAGAARRAGSMKERVRDPVALGRDLRAL